MSNVRIELNSDGIIGMMNSLEMQTVLWTYAERVAANAGIDTDIDVQPGKTRASARVTTASAEAYRDNAENNTLLRALI